MLSDYLNTLVVSSAPLRGCRRRVQQLEHVRHLSLRHLFTVTSLIVAIFAPFQSASAQELSLSLDAGLVTGAQLGESGGETLIQRQPTALAFDGNAVFDDELMEYTFGVVLQLEAPIAAAVYPKVRLLKPRGDDVIYAQVGLPWFVAPFRRFGLGVGGGYRHMLEEGFHFFAQGSLEFFLAGGDVPKGQSIITFSVVTGGRLTF